MRLLKGVVRDRFCEVAGGLSRRQGQCGGLKNKMEAGEHCERLWGTVRAGKTAEVWGAPWEISQAI